MRILGWCILREKNVDRMHQRTKEILRDLELATSDVASMSRSISLRDQEIEALRHKCSIVNVSNLENSVRRLTDELEMSNRRLREAEGKTETGVLGSLDGAAEGCSARD